LRLSSSETKIQNHFQSAFLRCLTFFFSEKMSNPDLEEDGFSKPTNLSSSNLVAVTTNNNNDQQNQQNSPTNSSYAARRAMAAAQMQNQGENSPTASNSSFISVGRNNSAGGERVEIRIPKALQIDTRRLVCGPNSLPLLGALASGREGSSSPGAAYPGSPNNSSMGSTSFSKSNSEVLGTGSFGTVIRADLLPLPGDGDQLPKPVAIKVLDRSKAESSTFMNMQAELDHSADLRHPCLVNTLGVFFMSSNESPLHVESIAIVMELAARGELLKYMKRYGLEDMPEVAPKFVAEVVLGLEFMASRKLIHRDLKPENLLLTAECHVKLSDFGTVCQVGGADAAVFRGTTAYAAPEVLTPGGSVTITTDLWALGCVVYELFVGRPPFQAESDYLLRQVIRARELEFPPYFPAEAKDLVSQLLEMDPTKRLGAAERGGFAALKQHPFFRTVVWETLLQQSHVTTLNADYQNEVGPLLLQGEEIVFAGHIKKERFLSVKQRLLVLTTFPRLFYIEPGTFTIKGQVPWSENIAAEAETASVFKVHTGDGQRVYHFVDDHGQRAAIWAAKINGVVKDQKAKARMKAAMEKKK
jgi:3-phosphoinositide dependent protein kinase-1